MKKKLIALLVVLILIPGWASAQQAYFIDGYHGGIYGHYPVGQTAFIALKLRQNPDWRVNLEIEPESWDVVKQRDPEGYAAFKRLFKDQSVETGRIEYVNPTYAQSYFFGTSGESTIRQFEYGMQLIRKHFPEAVFTTYSAEEPCFTSCLPTILKSFGFSYASTKNPNTMWGGYVNAYGGELVNWVGPDGTKLLTVPRYACENLSPNSTWTSVASYNSKEYIRKCLAAGIGNPVGMCIQDAAWSHGWDNGPWLGRDTSAYYTPTAYKTWRDYIRNCSVGTTTDDWHATQEDFLPGLMWGTQVMQRLATEVRTSENAIVQAEKMAAYGRLYKGMEWPAERIDEGWRTLLLSQHHDCWIVPYNNLKDNKNWAETVTDWTASTNRISREVIREAFGLMTEKGQTAVRVYNTLATERDELVSVEVPGAWASDKWVVADRKGKTYPAQLVAENGHTRLFFRAQVPSAGYASYALRKAEPAKTNGPRITQNADGTYLLESDLYALVIDPSRGGIIRSLKSAKARGYEYVDRTDERSFNEMRGYFVDEGRFISSTEQPAKVRIVEQGPLFATVAIEGRIGNHPFTQTIRLVQGDLRIEMRVKLDWKGNPHIGEPGIPFDSKDPRKAFYDDRYKLLVHFPVNLPEQQIYKNAPFDVCESRLENTFFNRWDSIKNNLILNWVDLGSRNKPYGLALFTDHTTSYAHGQDFPLSLDLQYAGKGLWGRDYDITRPTEITYAIMPHTGTWEKSRLWTWSERRNEPLLATLTGDSSPDSGSFFRIEDHAYELVSMTCKGNDLYIRLFNAQGNQAPKTLTFSVEDMKASLVELDGRPAGDLAVSKKNKASSVTLSIPRYGIRTLKISDIF